MENRCQYCVPLLLVATFSLITLCTAEALVPRYPTAFFSVRGGESRATSAPPSNNVDILYQNNHESSYKFSSTSLKEYMGEETIGENNREDSSSTNGLNGAESADVDSQSIKQIRVTGKGRVGATKMPPRNNKNKNGIAVEKVNRQDLGQLEDKPIHAEFIAETALPTDVGQFRLRAYRTDAGENEYTGREPSVIYAADKSPFGVEGQLNKDVPIRIHDQCLTSEVFRSRR